LVNLFPHITLTTETYSYLDQSSVNRDAQNVALCATYTPGTSTEALSAELINYVEIKDDVSICDRYSEDYGFVAQSASKLINDNIVEIVETQLVNGTGTSNQMFSLSSYSSEFAANGTVDLTAKIAVPNMADLLLGMATQIKAAGKLGAFKPNVAVVNDGEFFIKVLSEKDSQGRYLDPRVREVNGVYYINQLMIVASPVVAAGTCFVFDSTKGAILDRATYTLKSSTENGTNFVDGFTTLLGIVDLQFLVKKAEQNAFMKCTDVDTAITAITKPAV
jgi:HK97 family phage major capsid protein